MTPAHTTLEEAVAFLGYCACDAELLAADESRPAEERACLLSTAASFRRDQLALLDAEFPPMPPMAEINYLYGTVLDEGPDVSRLPHDAWVGLRNCFLLGIAGGLIAVAVVACGLWMKGWM